MWEVTVDKDKCTGDEECVEVCPVDVFEMVDRITSYNVCYTKLLRMDTMNGPADFLEVPKSPITGTVFESAKSHKMVHICEFTADLIKHGKLNLDPSRNDQYKVTFHDSCNTARGMGFFEEPRYILNNICNDFHEMP